MKTARRLGAFLLMLALLLALAGCGGQAAQPLPAPTQGETILPDAAQETEPPQGGAVEPSAPADAGRQETSTAAPPEPCTSEPPAASDKKIDAPSERAERVCTISVSCAAILEHLDRLAPEKSGLVPADGILLAATETEFAEGESAFDLLKRVCRANKIHMEFSETPVYQSAYVEGIGNLYEFDCGEGSGWMFRVNGAFPNVGCSRYALEAGDSVEWLYTCDFGADIGGGLAP